MTLLDLNTKIFADGAELEGMLAMYREPHIKGFTTNPTLMRKAGITDYRAFAKQVLAAIPDRPISFEVFSDEFADMERQAREIATWGEHVYVKIPVTNTNDSRRAADSPALPCRCEGQCDTIMGLDQVRDVVAALKGGAPSERCSRRIADTGRDPCRTWRRLGPRAQQGRAHLGESARPAQLFQAPPSLHIITVTNDILKKLSLVGRPRRLLARHGQDVPTIP